MPEGYVLTDGDRQAIQLLLDERRQKLGNKPIVQRAEEDHQAPETYIAYTEGIPALEAGDSDALDQPGVTDDNAIYHIVQNGGVFELEGVVGLSKRVYNLSSTAVDAGWILVTRDKYGSWVAVMGGGGGGGGTTDLVLALITSKTYTVNEFVRYLWKRVTVSLTPTPISYTFGSTEAEFAYEVNDIDIAVPNLVNMIHKSGFWVFERPPDWEFCEKTAVADEDGLFPANLLYYDQTAKDWVAKMEILLLDANA